MLKPLISEFEDVPLPDARLTTRLKGIVEVLGEHPAASFPDLFEDPSELEGFYRFINNERVKPDELLQGHRDRTLERCEDHQVVLAIHDSSEFAFPGERQGLSKLRKGESGFLGHFSLMVSPSGQPLGILAYSTVARQVRHGSNWLANYNDPNKESLRWGRQAAEVTELVGAKRVVHVMDREADSYELFDQLVGLGTNFVVRLSHDRRLANDEGQGEEDEISITEALERTAVRLTRRVELSRRGASAKPKQRATHPARDEREANLEIASCKVKVRRPHHDQKCAPELELNVVQVREPNAPEGQPAVEWRLVTNLPIDTREQVAAVVDHYRARWQIEEYFKAIKTGCGFCKRQATSLDALVRVLALLIPTAWRLLALRWTSRNDPDAPASTVLLASEIECIHALRPKLKILTARDACLAVAALGGHLKSNGPPGWQVLGRGFEHLTDMHLGFLAARRPRSPSTEEERRM